MNCSLIICTYNWPEALKLVLASVLIQSKLPNEIIIADDGSDENTSGAIKNFSKNSIIPVIHSWQEDIGSRISHSRNRAIARTKFDYVIMIDGDTVLHKHFIRDHVKYAKKGKYIQGSRVLLQEKFTENLFNLSHFENPSFFSRSVKNKFNMIRLPMLTYFMSAFKSKNNRRIRGCNFSLFKSDILKVNGFNEEITSWGREDSEFVQRLFNIGIYKQHLKFSGIQYHLFHHERVFNSQDSANENNLFLENAIQKKLVWCELGINRYL